MLFDPEAFAIAPKTAASGLEQVSAGIGGDGMAQRRARRVLNGRRRRIDAVMTGAADGWVLGCGWCGVP